MRKLIDDVSSVKFMQTAYGWVRITSSFIKKTRWSEYFYQHDTFSEVYSINQQTLNLNLNLLNLSKRAMY